MERIGQVLRRARERQGITLAEAREALHMHANYLEALEEEDFGRLPAPVYVRAFLRQYARYLGLDPEPLIREYVAAYPDQNAPEIRTSWTEAPEAGGSFWGKLAAGGTGLALAGLVLLAVYARWQFEAGKNAVARRASSGAAAQARRSGAVVPMARPAGPSAAPGAAERTGRVLPPGSPPAPATLGPAARSWGSGVFVEAIVSQPCWVRIRVDGKVRFQGLLRAGEVRSWRADRALDLLAGNAGGVRVVVNGKSVGVLGRAGQTVRRRFEATPPRVAEAPEASGPA